MAKMIHQKDINGCGIACLANLLNTDYEQTKKDFVTKFYNIDRGIKVFDMVSYLNTLGLNYKNKFFNHNKSFTQEQFDEYTKIDKSITLIRKSKKYPVGHYLLRKNGGWIDPWYNLPSIDKVHAGAREELLDKPWYVIYPIK